MRSIYFGNRSLPVSAVSYNKTDFSLQTRDNGIADFDSHADMRVQSARLVLALLWALFILIAGARSLSAQAVTVTNVYQQHYHYGYPIGNQDCSSGYNIPSGQYPSAYHLERGHAIHHSDPKNAADDYWVYWAHFDNSGYTVAEVAIFKSTTECGPYILQTNLYPAYNTDGSGYGFAPGGWQSRDEIIFEDNNQIYNSDGTVSTFASAYLISASDSLNSVESSSGSTCAFANDSIAIFQMTPDYLGITPTTNPSTNGANWAFVCDQREAPVMFKKNNKYFLITSQAAGWYPSQGGYGVSSNPLTGWTPDPLNLGNTSTFGGQTSDGFTIQGMTANTYVLTFDHLGGADSKNPASGEQTDTGEMWLPVILDDTAGTATLNWYPSWTVDNTTGVLTLPTLTDLAASGSTTATVASNSSYPTSNAIDGNYATRWSGTSTGSTSFNAVKPTTSTLCPVTGATTTTTCNPSLVVDLGAVYPVQEIDLSQYMIKGSESYFTYRIAYSSDQINWATLDYTTFNSASNALVDNISSVPFSNNITYGFNYLPVNFSARYVALEQVSSIEQNQSGSTTIYRPGLYEMAVIESTAPVSPEPVTVTLTPSTSAPATDSPFTVAVTVTGSSSNPTPTGYVQLTAPGYVSETYGLVNGTTSFTLPAGALTGGAEAITASYRPDPTSAPVYGIGTTTGSGNVNVSTPDAPTKLAVAQVSPGALKVSWTASIGAASYIINRSTNGGATYTQFATPTSTSYTDTGLNNGSTNYCYTVAAVNGAGDSTATPPVCSMATANFPVSGITVTPSGPGAITIAYAALTTATSYLIKSSDNSSAFTALPTAGSTTTTTSTSYLNSSLNVGDTYCYTVAAVFSTGTAADSSPVCAAATANLPPLNVVVTPWASGSLRLTWTGPASGATSYTVNRSINGGGYSSVATALTSPVLLDTGLTNYSLYCYSVSTALGTDTSTNSAAVCSTPTASFLAVPNNSFETPSEVSALWQTGPANLPSSTASWTFTGASGSSSGNNSGISYSSGTWTNHLPPPDGVQVAFVEEGGSIAQTIGGFTTGQNYTILVAAEQRQTSQPGANPFQIIVNGTSLGTFSPPQANAYYTDYGATFTATSSSMPIEFLGTSPSSTSAVLLDFVRIIPAPTGTLSIVPQSTAVTYGASSTTLTATATFNASTPPMNALVFRVNNGSQTPGTCSISGSTQTCTLLYSTATLAAGTYAVNVSYGGDANYAASTTSTTLAVNPATLIVTANNANILVGAAIPAFTASYAGFVRGDNAAVLSGSPSLTTTATSSSPAGVYPITVSQGTLTAANYTFSFANGTLSVVQAPTVSLTTSSVITGSNANGYTATITITNTGTGVVTGLTLTSATLGSGTGTPLPQTLGTLAAGTSGTLTVTFAGSVGADGAGVAEKYSGTYTGGSFSASVRSVKLP